MKKNHFLILMSFVGVVFGCSNDDDPAPIETPVTIDKSANLLGSGDSANDLLSNDSFSKLLIEIAYVEGFRPTATAMDEFVDYLSTHTFKVDIEIDYLELPSPGEEDLTLQEIADLESENRTAYNDGETLAVYIYFADAPSVDDDEEEGLVTLGAVYRNTSMVIHEVTVRRLAARSLFISDSDVEGATVNHEFGHLFGLVNLGSDPVNDHEDTEAPNHCNVEGCLMRAELQFSPSSRAIAKTSKSGIDGLQSACSLSGESVLRMLEQNVSKGQAVAPDLDAECVLDLQANGGR
ncbi:hypothetical protein FK220_002315 [Flavobacteriaceae bacterium TP-CH-4]|uniref:Membrane metalloprotease n=1 Tax=Pelagihabitans pacificus TaxID=2696054 RepID=A0A967ECD5_9FLAO|nr:hypothetical protein [Pelagihabitans pacificus]NHF58158.1 hypothetical protein [Pelagihabitans pacificus]